jgi:hypothetical protein
MKKVMFLLMMLVISLLVFNQASYALDLSGYLKNKIQIADDQTITGTNKLKIDTEMKGDNTYFLVSVVGVNNFGESNDTTFNLNRAYLDFYQSWGKVTAGMQNIAWGSGYLFNLADLFNQPNPIDPKGEKIGMNALDTKWNLTETARLEAVVLPGKTVSESDYGLRAQFTLGSFEITTNTLRKTLLSPTYSSQTARYAQVLECKGELGETAPGVWVQGGYFRDEPAVWDPVTYSSYVLGSDYTVALGNGLYLLGEYLKPTTPMDITRFTSIPVTLSTVI